MFKFRSSPEKKYRQLCKAARKGDLAAVMRLVEEGAEINRSGADKTPLFNAAYVPNGAECVSYLLEKGARVDALNSVGCTALMGAAEQGHAKAVELLLAAGADRTLRGRGNTAFDWAVANRRASLALALALPEPPRVESAHEVTLTRRLGNRLLEEVFDFSARERITLVRKDENGPVEAITRDGFSQVEDKARLREAFALYVKKGGAADESDIFPGTLAKPLASKAAPGGA